MTPFAKVLEPFVVAEGEDWAVLFKPAGMHSSRAGKRQGAGSSGICLSDFAGMAFMGEESHRNRHAAHAATHADTTDAAGDPAGMDPMMSRLDAETSGIVLFAKTQAARGRFRRAQETGLLEKRYLLVCAPSDTRMEGALPGRCPSSIDGETGLPIRIVSRFRSFGPRGAKVACIAETEAWLCGKKLAPGLYETLPRRPPESLPDLFPDGGQGAVPMEALISKGFRHQIRAHFAWCGWPIAGDGLYGGMPAERLFLEARALAFPDEEGGSVSVDLYGC